MQLGCLVNAALLHFFLLCVFSWMLCHGGIFYYLIIRAELLDKLKPKLKWSYVFGWGKATVIVSSCAETVTYFNFFNECSGLDRIVFK